MTLTINKLLETKEDFIKIPKTSAENVAALVVHAINIYQKDEELFFEIIQELMSDLQPLSNMLKDQPYKTTLMSLTSRPAKGPGMIADLFAPK